MRRWGVRRKPPALHWAAYRIRPRIPPRLLGHQDQNAALPAGPASPPPERPPPSTCVPEARWPPSSSWLPLLPLVFKLVLGFPSAAGGLRTTISWEKCTGSWRNLQLQSGEVKFLYYASILQCTFVGSTFKTWWCLYKIIMLPIIQSINVLKQIWFFYQFFYALETLN
jgi:hypothetical protein